MDSNQFWGKKCILLKDAVQHMKLNAAAYAGKATSSSPSGLELKNFKESIQEDSLRSLSKLFFITKSEGDWYYCDKLKNNRILICSHADCCEATLLEYCLVHSAGPSSRAFKKVDDPGSQSTFVSISSDDVFDSPEVVKNAKIKIATNADCVEPTVMEFCSIHAVSQTTIPPSDGSRKSINLCIHYQ